MAKKVERWLADDGEVYETEEEANRVSLHGIRHEHLDTLWRRFGTDSNDEAGFILDQWPEIQRIMSLEFYECADCGSTDGAGHHDECRNYGEGPSPERAARIMKRKKAKKA